MLQDLLTESLTLIICGTAAGERSAKFQNYYAQPGNKFWRTLYEVRLTSRLLFPIEYRELLKEKIGLTDLVKGKSGMDKNLKVSDFGDRELSDKIRMYRPKILCFNGKRAAQLFLIERSRINYGLQTEIIGQTRIYVAPSTSGAASRWWDIKYWEELSKLVEIFR